MKSLFHTLLICLGLALSPALWADHEGHRHGQETDGKLDNLSAAGQPSCCPSEGKPAQAAGAPPAPERLAAAEPPRPAMLGPGATDKPCASPGTERKPCMQREGCCCAMHGACRHCQQGGGCPSKGEGHCRQGGANEADLRARIHQLERRLDMMQSVLESLLERPEGGRGMGGHRGPQ